MALPERKAEAPDRKALAKAVEDLLLASGAELDTETMQTPAGVAKAFASIPSTATPATRWRRCAARWCPRRAGASW